MPTSSNSSAGGKPKAPAAKPKAPAKVQVAKPPAAPKAPVKAIAQRQPGSVPSAAKAIEKRIERAEPKLGIVEHGVAHSAGFRHGYLERTAVRVHKEGLTQCYRGIERLGRISVPVGTNAGTVLDKVQLNARSFGRVLPRYAGPFSKQLFTSVKLRFVPEPALIATTTQGSVYMGINFDPTAPLPVGDVGVDDIATWAPNDEMKAIRDSGDMWVHARLDLKSQIPLFIEDDDGSKDLQLISQGQMVFLSGTALNTGGSQALALGEWFIYFDVEFSQLNTSPGDVENGIMIGHVDSSATPGYDLGFYTQWLGDSEIVIAHDYATTAISFSIPSPGTYLLEMTDTPSGGSGARTAAPSLVYYAATGQPDPVPIIDNNLASTVTSQTFAVNMQTLTSNGVAALTADWHTNAGASGSNTSNNNSAAVVRYCFSAPQGTAFLLTTATYNFNIMGDIVIAKIDGVFHADGKMTSRTSPNAQLSLRGQRIKFLVERDVAANVGITDAEKLAMLSYIKTHQLDPAMLNVLIDKCELPITKMPVTTCIVPALAAVAAWAVATFGPVLAERACRWIEHKLTGKPT